MRNKKNILSVNVDSALALMQEIYNDVAENRHNASVIMKKMLAFMKDAEDMTMIGPVIKDQQKILNDCTEKKLSLVKLQGILLKQEQSNNGNQNSGKMMLTDEDKDMIEQLLKETSSDEKDNTEKYKIE